MQHTLGKVNLIVLLFVTVLFSCNRKKAGDISAAVQYYLEQYNLEYQKLYAASAAGQWMLNTHIVEGDTVASHNAAVADEAMAKFTGSKANIDSARKYLALQDQLTPLQIRQLQTILFNAGNNPETAGDVVKKRIEATNAQTEKLYGFHYMLDGKATTVNALDHILQTSDNMEERLRAWNASKEVGSTLKDGLANLRDLRNQSVTPLGYSDFFQYMASEYGMNTDEMMQLTHGMIADVWPLYRELHTWARYDLAAKYHQPVPDYLPAQWLPNRWGQDWTSLVKVEGLDIDTVLQSHDPEWIVKQGEKFYQSLGFGPLPASFWTNSSLYPVAADAGYSKNNHASAWHMDLDTDVRSLMSVETNTEWWSTVLHELGHIYYYQSYSNPEVPYLLRNGANRGYHEAFGTMMGLASLQKPFLEGLGMIKPGTRTNDTLKLLSEALDYVIHIPWEAV